MQTIQGIYENGEIKLLEEAPYKGNQKVLITFIEGDDEDKEIRNLSLIQVNESMAEYLKDDRENLYQDYAKKNKSYLLSLKFIVLRKKTVEKRYSK